MVIVLMGVAGSGKSTIGRLLAARMGCQFYDGDDYHSEANVAKMAKGEPLDDTDRDTWLARLRVLVDDLLSSHQNGVLACSALKSQYRETLGLRRPGVALVFLKGDSALLFGRLRARTSHFMRESMLASQLDDLQEPTPADTALVVDVAAPPDAIVDRILETLPS